MTRPVHALSLVALGGLACCRSAPVLLAEDRIGVVEAYVVDPDTGRLVRGDLPRGDVTVAFDSVVVVGGRVTLSGRAEIEGRGGYGFVRLVEGYDRTGIPEPTPPPERPGPYPWVGPRLADDALAYGATLYRSGRFTLRAPLGEAERDTLLFAYGDIDDWVRVPVTDLLRGRRFWASVPGAVPNPEARSVDGLTLRPTERTASPGDSVRFVLAYRPRAARRRLGAPTWELPTEPARSSPMFGTSCGWRVERWADGWQAAPRARQRATQDGIVMCTAQGIRFAVQGELREAFQLSSDAEPGRYRWCLDTHTEDAEATVERAACSTAFVVEG